MMTFNLDTSVFAQAHRQYYAFDIAPLFWDALSKLAEKGAIVSPRAVYEELMDGNDELKEWAKRHRKILFLDPDAKVNAAYREVVESVNARYRDQHWIREFLSRADPWVIAHARAHDLTVVTMELGKSSEDIDRASGKIIGKIKIPNVCDHFGLKIVSTFELLRELGIKLN